GQHRPRVRPQAFHEVLVAPRPGDDLTPHHFLGNLRDHLTPPPGRATEKTGLFTGRSVCVRTRLDLILGPDVRAPRPRTARVACGEQSPPAGLLVVPSGSAHRGIPLRLR